MILVGHLNLLYIKQQILCGTWKVIFISVTRIFQHSEEPLSKMEDP